MNNRSSVVSPVFIPSSQSIKALVATRGLGFHQIPIYTLSDSATAISRYSRYSRAHFRTPSPVANPVSFIHSLGDILSHHPGSLLMPVHSDDTLLVAKHRESLISRSQCLIPYHNYRILREVNNKALLLQTAESLGIPIPKTWFPSSADEVHDIASLVSFPAVIKLRESASSIGLAIVHSPDELVTTWKQRIIQYHLSLHDYPIVQEYVQGTGYGVSFLFNQGDMRALFTHRRIREWPVGAGPSTARISTRYPRMETYARQLLEHYSWHGVAMVEFKADENGNIWLMEVNPRFWGSLNMAISAGVDFPYLLYQMATTGDVPRVTSWNEGVRSQNWMLDLFSLLKGNDSGVYPFAIREYLRLPVHDDILSIRDPAPEIMNLFQLAKNWGFIMNRQEKQV